MHTLREKFMERILREIFQRKGSGFVLKGGAALRSIFGEQRYTKDIDLDFTNPKRTADSLHNSIEGSVKRAARGLGITDVTMSSPGKDERSPRWKLNFRDNEGNSYHIEIEVSRDEKRAVPGRIVVQAFTPNADRGIARFWVDIYDQQALIASKIAAIFGRGLPRDVYDLDVLHTAGPAPDDEQMRWALSFVGAEDQDPSDLLSDRMDSLTWERFQSDLRDSLVPAVANRIDHAEWQALKDRVSDYVTTLLEKYAGDSRE